MIKVFYNGAWFWLVSNALIGYRINNKNNIIVLLDAPFSIQITGELEKEIVGLNLDKNGMIRFDHLLDMMDNVNLTKKNIDN